MLKDLSITPEDPTELKAVNKLLAEEVKALSLKVEQLKHQLHGANRHRFGLSQKPSTNSTSILLRTKPLPMLLRNSAIQFHIQTKRKSASTAANRCQRIWSEMIRYWFQVTIAGSVAGR